MPNTAYQGREQTATKHFILRRYLQTLAFKLLQSRFPSLTYVDGFSGPWMSQKADYSDTSFMIAIKVLKDAQRRVREQGPRKRVQCFFVEKEASSYDQLRAAVAQHHDPENDFFVHTFHGRFEDAVDKIMEVVGQSFALTFIDPTGWTGYEFDKIARILQHKPGEAPLNYMKPFIDRFTAHDNHKNVSFEGLLGRDWQGRLDLSLPRNVAVQALFDERFRNWGQFSRVVSTPIEKLEDRTAFSIVYGTRSEAGLEAYRDSEFSALKDQGVRRIEARDAARSEQTGMRDLFTEAGIHPPLPIEQQVRQFCGEARDWLLRELREGGPRRFDELWPPMLENFTIRKTNAKSICADLAQDGIIHASWRDGGSRRRTPSDDDIIVLLETAVV